MSHILVVEDDPKLKDLIYEMLQSQFQVSLASGLNEAKAQLLKHNIHLVLLDLGLPDGSGYELCTYIKNSDHLSGIPVVILSGQVDVTAKVAGFELGADDYIEKPFHREELFARIKSKISKLNTQESAKPQIIGPFIIDSARLKIFVKTSIVKDLYLSLMEYKILSCLLRNEGRIYTREQLISVCSGEGHSVSDRTIDTHVYSLRKKLPKETGRIVTHYGSGYSFENSRQS